MIFIPTKVKSKKNKEVILRMIQSDEAQQIIDTMIEISETAPYLLTSTDHFRNISLEDEVKWIKSYNDDPRALLIVVEYDKKIVGILDFKAYKNPKTRHRGGLGISLHPSVRGEGIGELLFNKLLSEVKKIEGLSMIELSVMSDNIQAYELYRKVGFIEVGRRPMAYRQPDGLFNDDIFMIKTLNVETEESL